jgi:hypothetical protein
MQKLKFQKHLQHQIILGKRPKKHVNLVQDCILNIFDLTTVQQGCVTEKNYLFQRHMAHINIHASQNEEFQMLQYVVLIMPPV